MPTKYPFLDRVRERLDTLGENGTITWLAGEIGKSPRWFYKISDFTKMELIEIELISSKLGYNFIVDYNRWAIANDEEALSIWQEPEQAYDTKMNRVTVNLKISASEHIAESNLSKMIIGIRKLGDELGFKLD